jgi:hypothetical protein
MKHEQGQSDTSVFEEDLQFLQTLSNHSSITNANPSATNPSLSSTLGDSQSFLQTTVSTSSQQQQQSPSFSPNESPAPLNASNSEIGLNINSNFLSSSNSSASLNQQQHGMQNSVSSFSGGNTNNSSNATGANASSPSPINPALTNPSMMTGGGASANNPMMTNTTTSATSTNNTSNNNPNASSSPSYARAHGQATSLVLPPVLRSKMSTSSQQHASGGNPMMTNTSASTGSSPGTGSHAGLEGKVAGLETNKKTSLIDFIGMRFMFVCLFGVVVVVLFLFSLPLHFFFFFSRAGVSKEAAHSTAVKYFIYHMKGKGVVTTDRSQVGTKTIRNVLETLKLSMRSASSFSSSSSSSSSCSSSSSSSGLVFWVFFFFFSDDTFR